MTKGIDMTDFTGVFFEGDRMMTPFYPTVVAVEMLRAVNAGQAILTGTNDGGIEQLVRIIAEDAGVEIQVVEQSPDPDPANPGHWVDWDARHKGLADDVEVLVIHVDHQTCRESVSAVRSLPESRVRMWTAANLSA